MKNEPGKECPRSIPAKYSCPAIAADTAKDLIWELGNACPAIKPYLERLLAADDAMRISMLVRGDGTAVGFGESPVEKWRRLWCST